jgi:hypothetical protein
MAVRLGEASLGHLSPPQTSVARSRSMRFFGPFGQIGQMQTEAPLLGSHGSEPRADDEYPDKPPRMRWATYNRLMDRLVAAGRVTDERLALAARLWRYG